MDKVKFEELMKKEDFVKKVFESKTSKELESILKKEGLEVSETDLKQIMDSIAVLTKTSTPVEIKDPTIPTPIPISDEQSIKISGGIKTGYTLVNKGSRPGEVVYRSYEPYSPANNNYNSDTDENDNQGIFLHRKPFYDNENALTAAGIFAGILAGGYAIYRRHQNRKKNEKNIWILILVCILNLMSVFDMFKNMIKSK